MEKNHINRVPEGKISYNWFEDGILVGQFAPDLVIDLRVAKETTIARKKFGGGKSYPYMLEASEMKSINKEARDYFASKDGTEYILGAAIMTTSFLSKVMFNFFMVYNKPRVPTKSFTDRAEAKKWLEQFRVVTAQS